MLLTQSPQTISCLSCTQEQITNPGRDCGLCQWFPHAGHCHRHTGSTAITSQGARIISLSLISVPKLYRIGCKVAFRQNIVTITDNWGTALIMGQRDPRRNLYMIKVPTHSLVGPVPPSHQISLGTYTIRPTEDLIQYHHATTGVPPLGHLYNCHQLRGLQHLARTHRRICQHTSQPITVYCHGAPAHGKSGYTIDPATKAHQSKTA